MRFVDWISILHIRYITCLINRKKRSCCLYVGEDLDVLLALCDRILVLCGGKMSGIVDARTTTKEEVGLMMTSIRKGDTKDE